MNEQTPRDPYQPEHDGAEGPVAANDPAPRNPVTPTDADSASATAVYDTAPEPAQKRGRGILKPILVGSAAAAVVLAVAGVGMSIADAVDDGDDPAASTSTSEPAQPGAAPGATPSPSTGADDHGGDRDDDDSDDGGSAAPAAGVSSEPSDLAAALEAAVRAAGGGSATSVEIEDGGWKVDVRLDDGSELDVRVPVSGEPLVRADDDDDRSSDAPLDPTRVADISAAAIAAAGGGTVLSIEAEDDERVRFEVEVLQGGEDVDVDLADDLSVVAVDR
ncbi:hypothetical protein [Agrococcus sp. DT81.2]|uniref:hypothetical protein n=1 Tax=Agrococcus sp. DT81.2 TaxID=3393414 RepID=UPI003CE59BDC